jgi:hypothetical protein
MTSAVRGSDLRRGFYDSLYQQLSRDLKLFYNPTDITYVLHVLEYLNESRKEETMCSVSVFLKKNPSEKKSAEEVMELMQNHYMYTSTDVHRPILLVNQKMAVMVQYGLIIIGEVGPYDDYTTVSLPVALQQLRNFVDNEPVPSVYREDWRRRYGILQTYLNSKHLRGCEETLPATLAIMERLVSVGQATK